MTWPSSSTVHFKREKRGVIMAVNLHKLLGAVNKAGEVLKQKWGICVHYLEISFMFCRIYQIRSLRIMWDCIYLKFQGHGVK